MNARSKRSRAFVQRQTLRIIRRAVGLGLGAACTMLTLAGLSASPAAAEVPVIKADSGPCRADFTVTDKDAKPLYAAKIRVVVRTGFMSKRKTELEIGTNADGKARVEGLPAKTKKPMEFVVRHDSHSKSLMHSPAVDCQASYTVVLGAD